MPLNWSDRLRTRTQDIKNAIDVAYNSITPITSFPGVTPGTGADLTVAIESAIASATNGRLVFTPGDYRITGTVDISRSNLVIEIQPGAVIRGDHTAGAANVFTVSGTKSTVPAETTALFTSVTAGQQDAITVVSTAGFAVGDWIILEDEQLDSVEAVDGSPSYTDSAHHSEINRIREITDATHIKLYYMASDTYNAATAGRIVKFTPVEKLYFTGGGLITNTGTTSTTGGHGLKFSYAVDCGVSNLNFRNVRNQALKWEECRSFFVDQCNFKDADWFNSNGYGVTTTSCIDGVIQNCRGYRLRHAFDISFFSRDILVSACTAKSSAFTPFIAHPDCKRVVFDACIVDGVRGYSTGAGTEMDDSGNFGHGFQVRETCTDIVIQNCTATNTYLSGIALNNGGCSRLVVKNNYLYRCNHRGVIGGAAILSENANNTIAGNTCEGLVIDNNVIEACYGVAIYNSFSGATITNNKILQVIAGTSAPSASGSALTDAKGIWVTSRAYTASSGTTPVYTSISTNNISGNDIQTVTYGIVVGLSDLHTTIPANYTCTLSLFTIKNNRIYSADKSGIHLVTHTKTVTNVATTKPGTPVTIADNTIIVANVTATALCGGIVAADLANVDTTPLVEVYNNRVSYAGVAGIFGGFNSQRFIKNIVNDCTDGSGNTCGIYYKSYAAGQNLGSAVFIDNIIANNQLDGLRINENATVGTVSEAVISGGVYYGNGRYGIRIHEFNGRSSSTGIVAYNNATAGLRIDGDNHTSTNDVCYDTKSSPTQDYGIDIAAAATGTILRNPIAYGNELGQIRDGGGATMQHTLSMPGELKQYAGTTAPPGWLLCDGTAVSRAVYAALFAITSTTYGVGDGSTTFNLPDLRDKFARGKSGSVALGATGGTTTYTHAGTAVGAHSTTTVEGPVATPTTVLTTPATHTVTQPNAHTAVEPPYLSLNYIIKY